MNQTRSQKDSIDPGGTANLAVLGGNLPPSQAPEQLASFKRQLRRSTVGLVARQTGPVARSTPPLAASLRLGRMLIGFTVLCLLLALLRAGAASTTPDLFAAPGTQTIPPEMRLEALPEHSPEPVDNPSTPAKIELGRLLFFDPVLSSSRKVSCATCHNPRFGWTDGRATPIGVGGSGAGPARTFQGAASLPVLDRNVPTILNVGFNGLVSGADLNPASAPMFWDSRVQGLERQIIVPLTSLGEMRDDTCAEDHALAEAVTRLESIGEYRDRFGKAFGETAKNSITPEHFTRAIAAFERSLVMPRTPFDRFIEGDTSALNATQQKGLRIFREAGCQQCHGGPMFSDFKLHFIGVPDSTRGGRRKFRTPTLRNLRHTAPYMHNGSLRTLRNVLIFYDQLSDAVSESLDGGDNTQQPPLDPLLKHLNLNPDEYPALEAFLDALSTDDYNETIPAKVPSCMTVIP